MKLFEIVFLKQNCIVSKQSKRNNRIKNPFIKPLTKWADHVWAHLGGSSAGVTSILQIIWSLTVTKACIIQLYYDQYIRVIIANKYADAVTVSYYTNTNQTDKTSSTAMVYPYSLTF